MVQRFSSQLLLVLLVQFLSWLQHSWEQLMALYLLLLLQLSKRQGRMQMAFHEDFAVL
jgi:hypothetical protein